MNDILIFLAGLVAGVVIALIINKLSDSKKDDSSKTIDVLNEKLNDLQTEKGRADALQSQLEELKEKHQRILTEYADLKANAARKEEALENIRKQKEELEKIKDDFTKQFKLIANEILENSTNKLSKANAERLSTLIDPLKRDINDFKETINRTHSEEMKVKGSLMQQVKQLTDMNQQLSSQAKNLADALKGESKTQGDWGELLLERILEQSGLVEGEHFKRQMSVANEEGGRDRPDFVIFLPDNKHIIIDSKVSLTAYEKMVHAEDKEERTKFAKQHVQSVKSHIDELSSKSYHDNKEFNSPDFTLMFLPIEASFSTALKEDAELFNYAWKKRIVIVSPTSLLATLMTIGSIWKQEKQTKNVMEIARQGGALYDKFTGLLADLEDIGKHIQKTDESYNKAINKLKDGKGNLIGRVEKLKKLGAETKKEIGQEWKTGQNLLSETSDTE